MASVEKDIHVALIGLLGDAEELLRIDARTVHVWPWFPEQTFKTRELPLVAALRPEQRGSEPFDNVMEREEYSLTIFLMDSFKPSDSGIQEAIERLDALRGKVRDALLRTPYLGLVGYDVMPGFWTFTRASEPETLGNNLMRMRCELIVPVLIRHPEEV